ncbi:hypothetical protein Aph01nite_58280 [Acrocarpospora phusangensis]|uniref:Uncharacterized protein n=1 Tax=Acrocarpospora phusangensis TaxID=1070424 RepID=A0A919QEZ6_9ACTN|nr:hypothetical protein Aph01nite_58280 [Acrocarpospora phusangensis]
MIEGQGDVAAFGEAFRVQAGDLLFHPREGAGEDEGGVRARTVRDPQFADEGDAGELDSHTQQSAG